MYMKNSKLTWVILMLSLSVSAVAQVVRFETDFGNIDMAMRADVAPLTVQNFLNYVNDGDFDETIFHRAISGFIVQGGVFRLNGNRLVEIPEDSSVQNEFNLSNTRGTVAMAKLGGQPNSATSSFFINVANNSSNLDNQNGGFTVFAEVISGMETVDLIASLRMISEIPLFNYISGQIQAANYVFIRKAFVLSDVFQINAGLSGAWFNPDTNGQGLYLEVLPDADTVIVGWYTFDNEAMPASEKAIGDSANRWLTAAGSFDGNTFVGNIFKTSGGLFDDPQAVTNTQVGSMSIVFNNCTTAVFSYDLQDSNLANTMNIQRISGSNVALCEQLADEANPGVSTQ